MTPGIAELRREYSSQTLLEKDVAKNPFDQFKIWWSQVLDSQIVEPNAMTLATASADGFPSARVVLLKGFSNDGFEFYTNYKSFKALQINENPKACLVFHWKELERQVRIIGLVKKLSEEVSTAYFKSRPKGSQVGAWASPQSQVIESREWLDDEYSKKNAELKEIEIDKPAHWGGYIVQPVIMEFWQGRPSRLHDRIQYSLDENGEWKIERLAP